MRRSASHCELVDRLFSAEAFPTKPMLGFKWIIRKITKVYPKSFPKMKIPSYYRFYFQGIIFTGPTGQLLGVFRWPWQFKKSIRATGPFLMSTPARVTRQLFHNLRMLYPPVSYAPSCIARMSVRCFRPVIVKNKGIREKNLPVLTYVLRTQDHGILQKNRNANEVCESHDAIG